MAHGVRKPECELMLQPSVRYRNSCAERFQLLLTRHAHGLARALPPKESLLEKQALWTSLWHSIATGIADRPMAHAPVWIP